METINKLDLNQLIKANNTNIINTISNKNNNMFADNFEMNYTTKEIFLPIKNQHTDYFILNNDLKTKDKQFLFLIKDNKLILLKYNYIYNEFSLDYKIVKTIHFDNKDNKAFPNLMTYAYFLNKLYLLFSNFNYYIYDFDDDLITKISLLEEQTAEYGLLSNLKYFSTSIIETKLFITGGLYQEKNKNVFNKKLYSFDLAFYTLAEEKLKDNLFKGRYCHSSINIHNYIYIIGGFDTILNDIAEINSNEKAHKSCESILLAKYDHTLYQWSELKLKGPVCKDLIVPEVSFYKNQYLLCVSSYRKQFCLFFVDLKHSTSNTVYLSDVFYKEIGLNINSDYNYSNTVCCCYFYFNEKDNVDEKEDVRKFKDDCEEFIYITIYEKDKTTTNITCSQNSIENSYKEDNSNLIRTVKLDIRKYIRELNN